MKFISVKEASKKGNISIRKINKLLNEGIIEGSYKTGIYWNIPME